MYNQLFNYSKIGEYIANIITIIINISLISFCLYLSYKLIKFLIFV